MRIINIVDSVDKINYGVWHAATANAGLLAQQGIQTELWYPAAPFDELDHVVHVPLPTVSVSYLQKNIINERKLDPANDIIITHGAWQYPTRWGAWLRYQKFNWIYVPHGMLDPWAMNQKRIKKAIYFRLIEKRFAKKADLIKAVSLTESESLQAFFSPSRIRFIPNGVTIEANGPDFQKRPHQRCFLFLSRLHAKKNLVTLAAAWTQSALNNNENYKLLIAGPDQGELAKLTSYFSQSNNMQYVGSVYGDTKRELLQQCTYYVLPSFSEGLPSSLLEAMSYGLIPIITEACNLPEVFTKNLGVKIATEQANITAMLEQAAVWDIQKIKDTGLQAWQFVRENYSIEAVTALQIDIFSRMLDTKQSAVTQ